MQIGITYSNAIILSKIIFSLLYSIVVANYHNSTIDAAETVLDYFGFDRTVYGNPMNSRKKKKWYEELHQERTKDIQAEMMMEKQ